MIESHHANLCLSGNVIHPHTNLTEIKLAAELLWRVGVRPDQVSMGFGFYGRSYTLSDPSCTTPGVCRFSTGGNPGPCTATSGYLSYYEIKDVLAKNPGIVVRHDVAATVKYFSWGSNQWIAYDDADTFKQKVDWANSVGFSGSLIWASDLGKLRSPFVLISTNCYLELTCINRR